jgi:hypothetical protein
MLSGIAASHKVGEDVKSVESVRIAGIRGVQS